MGIWETLDFSNADTSEWSPTSEFSFGAPGKLGDPGTPQPQLSCLYNEAMSTSQH